MKFNYATEQRKFIKEWKKLYKEYNDVGMDEQVIQAMYEFDLNVFRKNRNECNHTQPLVGSLYDDEIRQDDSVSTLLKKFDTELSVRDKHCFQSSPRYAWIDEIENDELYLKIILLPEKDIDLLTLIVFEGYTQREIAKMRGVTPAAICKNIKNLKKLLSKG